MFDKKGAHYGLQVFTRSRNYFLCTKALGLLTRRVQMPQVVGALLAGLLLGPAGVGILTDTTAAISSSVTVT